MTETVLRRPFAVHTSLRISHHRTYTCSIYTAQFMHTMLPPWNNAERDCILCACRIAIIITKIWNHSAQAAFPNAHRFVTNREYADWIRSSCSGCIQHVHCTQHIATDAYTPFVVAGIYEINGRRTVQWPLSYASCPFAHSEFWKFSAVCSSRTLYAHRTRKWSIHEEMFLGLRALYVCTLYIQHTECMWLHSRKVIMTK